MRFSVQLKSIRNNLLKMTDLISLNQKKGDLKTHLMKFVCSYIDSVKFCRQNLNNQSRPTRLLRPRRKRTRYDLIDGSDSEVGSWNVSNKLNFYSEQRGVSNI